MDSLTVAGIIFSLVAIGLAFYSMWYNQNMTKKRLRKIARATLALQANSDEQALCQAIKEIAPHACPLLDYTLENKDGKTVITNWSAKDAKPRKEVLRKILEDIKQAEKSGL